MRIELQDEEVATVLAALKYYQHAVTDNDDLPPDEVQDLATAHGEIDALDSVGVEDLYDRISGK